MQVNIFPDPNDRTPNDPCVLLNSKQVEKIFKTLSKANQIEIFQTDEAAL